MPSKPPTKPTLSADDIVHAIPIHDLVLDPKNTRRHGDRDLKAIVASIKQWGWTSPIIAREGTNQVIAGHGRIQAALRIGMTTVPVVFKRFATDHDAKAYAIADNRIAELSGWDLPNLKDILTDLEGTGYDIALTGWSPEDLDKLLAWDSKTEKDPDAIPAVQGPVIAKLGDLWILGEHRIVCGDATDPEVWARLMNGRQAACVFTDQPYGVAYQATSGKFTAIKNDALEHAALSEFLWKTFRNLVAHADQKAGFYIWHASSTRQDFAEAMTLAGLAEQQYLIWVKPAAVLGHDDYQWAHEPCFYAAKGGQRPTFYGDRAQPTVWRFSPVAPDGIVATVGRGLTLLAGPDTLHLTTEAPKTKKQRTLRMPIDKPITIEIGNSPNGSCWEVSRDHKAEHPTQKPVELAMRAIRNSSQYGDVVTDAFLGSGSTLMGAEMLGRACYGTELEPKYIDVIVKRWEQFTGKKAERA